MTDQNAIISNLEITHRKKPQYSEEQRKKHYQDYQASKLSIEKYCELRQRYGWPLKRLIFDCR